MLAVPLLAAAAFTFGAPAVDARQEAHADLWQFHISPIGAYCEGCCKPNSLCCNLPQPCRVTAPEEPTGGG